MGIYSPGLALKSDKEDMLVRSEVKEYLQGIGGVGHEQAGLADCTIANDDAFNISVDTHRRRLTDVIA